MRNNLISIYLLSLLSLSPGIVSAQTTQAGLVVGRLKYNGGGDWYNDPSCIPNLLAFLKATTNIQVGPDEARIQIMDEELFSLPLLYLTGHGRIYFSTEEAARLRLYLTSGGFLYVDDDYGLDKYFRQEIKKVFPDKKLVELPLSHEIFHQHFNFPNGLPKTHEHEPGAPQAFGIFHEGRMVVFYTFNSNISDGWADPTVHEDSEAVRLEALRMGVNILVYALTQ
jgi:hypothetical protein